MCRCHIIKHGRCTQAGEGNQRMCSRPFDEHMPNTGRDPNWTATAGLVQTHNNRVAFTLARPDKQTANQSVNNGYVDGAHIFLQQS